MKALTSERKARNSVQTLPINDMMLPQVNSK